MKTIRLTKGLGEFGTSHCVMAATSIVAGEEFTDKPKCVCPTITSALINLNDSYNNNAAREEALGHLPWFIIGTRGTLDHEMKRAFLFADWAVRICCGIECEPIIDQKTANAAANAAYTASASASGYASASAADAAAAANAAAAAYAANAHAAYAAANAATYAVILDHRKELVAYIESTIIPVYTTMPIEPGFRSEYLITY